MTLCVFKNMENTTVYLFEKFLEIEDKNNLFDYQIGNIKIWQYIRYTVCAQLLEEISGIRTTSMSDYLLESDKMGLLMKLKRNQFLIHKKDFLIIAHPRRVKEDNKYRCFVTEEFVSCLRKSYYVFEEPFCGKHFEPAATKNLKYIDLRYIMSHRYKIYKEKNDLKEIRLLVNYICELFIDGFEIDLNKDFRKKLVDIIREYMVIMCSQRIYVKLILGIIRPKAIFVTVSYNLFNQVLISVAKQMRIPTIELQHGRLGETHCAYNFRSCHQLESFPDYVFVYGEYERQKVRFPINKEHIFAVGYPELEKKARFYNSIDREQKCLTIVFAAGSMENEIMSKYAIEIGKQLIKNDVRVIYKLHPSEYQNWETKYPQLKQEFIQVIDNNDHSIYYYLGQADYVIGISSTALFEAMMFKTQILVIREMDYKKSEAIYINKCAELISSIDEIVDIIKNRKQVRQRYNCDFYFKKHAIRNMNEAMKEILGNEGGKW